MATFQLKYAPGVVSDDTVLVRGGRIIDADKMRWARAGVDQPLLPELIGGWERLTLTALTGVCRNAHAWIDNAGLLNIAFGTHSKLFVWRGGGLYDITPFGPPTRLGSNPFTVTNGSAVVNVHQVAHGYPNATPVKVFNATSAGRQTLNGGPYTISVVDADHYTITLGASAVVTRTLGANPLSVTISSAVVTVTETAHNIAAGTAVTFAGASALGGITPNGTFPITVIDADHYSYTFTSPATSTATGGGAAVTAAVPTTGGGAVAVVVPQTELPAGQVNGTGTAGYGTGGYGVGGYGQPSTADYFPRTWSFGNLGQALVASPRGGAAYIWNNDTAQRAACITEAPHHITSLLVTPERAVMAMGCNEEASNLFNPRCIRTSDLENETVWTTAIGTAAEETILEGAGRIVGGKVAGYSPLVWTDNEVWQADFQGAADQTYRYTRQASGCGLIGPNAAVVRGQRAYWPSPDLQFYAMALGGEPVQIPCPMREEVKANLTPSQKDKIIGSALAGFGEAWFFYPDARDGLEVSRAVFMSLDDGWWSKAQLVRTAFIDAGPADHPVGVDASGNVFWHERGTTADGGPRSWSLSAGPQYIDAGQQSIFLRAFWPDFTGQGGGAQVGTVSLTVQTYEKPQSAPTVSGPFMLPPGLEKVDLRCEGRLIAWQITGNSGPAAFRMGTPIAEGKPGRRPK